MGHRMLPIAFLPDPLCHANEIWDKISYSSACVRDFWGIFRIYGDYGNETSNPVNRIFSRPTPVAMATEFETKLAITRLA